MLFDGWHSNCRALHSNFLLDVLLLRFFEAMNKSLNILLICLLTLSVGRLECDTAAIIDSFRTFRLVHDNDLLALLLASSRLLAIL